MRPKNKTYILQKLDGDKWREEFVTEDFDEARTLMAAALILVRSKKQEGRFRVIEQVQKVIFDGESRF